VSCTSAILPPPVLKEVFDHTPSTVSRTRRRSVFYPMEYVVIFFGHASTRLNNLIRIAIIGRGLHGSKESSGKTRKNQEIGGEVVSNGSVCV